MRCTLAMHSHANKMCHVSVFVCVRVYACRGIEIPSHSAGPMLQGFLAYSRSHLSGSVFICAPLSVKTPCVHTQIFLAPSLPRVHALFLLSVLRCSLALALFWPTRSLLHSESESVGKPLMLNQYNRKKLLKN